MATVIPCPMLPHCRDAVTVQNIWSLLLRIAITPPLDYASKPSHQNHQIRHSRLCAPDSKHDLQPLCRHRRLPVVNELERWAFKQTAIEVAIQLADVAGTFMLGGRCNGLQGPVEAKAASLRSHIRRGNSHSKEKTERNRTTTACVDFEHEVASASVLGASSVMG